MAQTKKGKADKCLEKMLACQNIAANTYIAREQVNQSLIGQWCDAFGDRNPIYCNEELARSHGWPGLVAPPAMLNTWTMPGNITREEFGDDPFLRCITICDEAGYMGVVATNTDHEYLDYLKIGDQIHATQIVSNVSALKTTALGTGYFITTNTEFKVDERCVGRMLFRIFKYKPNSVSVPTSNQDWRMRPAPAISRDTAFFWEGLKQGELRIQKCQQCKKLHHPPLTRCSNCGAYDLGHQVSTGAATLYSFVEPYHPVVPFMRHPYIVGLVELDEGTRLISNIINCPPSKLTIGMKLKLCIEKMDENMSLPMFTPNPAIKRDMVFKRREQTLYFDAVEIGDELPPWKIPITPTLIVAGAMASRDYYPVHHDRDAAQERGAADIFTNIMTTQGLCARYVNDWFGVGARFRSMRVQLGAPNYPKDTLTIRAYISDKSATPKEGLVNITLKGENQIGDHVNALIVVQLPSQ